MDDADSEVGAPIDPVIETSEKTTTEKAEDQPRVPITCYKCKYYNYGSFSFYKISANP